MMDFIELQAFTSDWDNLGLGDSELFELQDLILGDPHEGPVIPGTGGLRKLRFAPRVLGRGKRGGLRVLYVYFEVLAVVVLVKAYAKNVKDNLAAAEKKAIHRLIDRVRAEIARRFPPTDGRSPNQGMP
jgi:hypothetical protein